MTNAEKTIVRWLSGVSAMLSAIAAVLVGSPTVGATGELVPSWVLLLLLALSGGLSALLAVVNKPAVESP